MVKKPKQPATLPKAPMVEVVFELRWTLQSGPPGEPVLQSDPGLLPLLGSFSGRMKKLGFSASTDLSHPLQTGPHGVVRRFFKTAKQPFPLMQIGPGIFATNEDAKYDWKEFRLQVNRGLKALLLAYPKLDFFPLVPNYLELRYIDVFNPSIVGAVGFLGFLGGGTTLKVELPSMLRDEAKFTADAVGRLIARKEVRGRKNTEFALDIGSGRNQNTSEDIVRMETKVTTTSGGVPALKSPARFLKDVGDWLDFAHGITSPFFKDLIKPSVLSKYGMGT
jgi:uncharacterized protein (TIGR04255 family)